MKRNCKRFVSILFAIVMLLGMLPTSVHAAEEVSLYGRSVLSSMANAEALLYAYDQLVEGVEVSKAEITVYDGVHKITQAEIEMVMDAYVRDYTEHFWLGKEYRIMANAQSVVKVLPTYCMSGSELEEAKDEYESMAEEVLSGITSSMSDYEKELYIHDKLASMIVYEFTENAHNSYGALVEGKAVCEGYAEVFQDLLKRVGIQGFIALGTSKNPTTGTMENHEWNYVKINGKYYHVDLTWNDQNELFHAYFNQSDARIREDHVIREAAYALPVCDSTDAFYFENKETNLSTYTTTLVGNMLKENNMKVHVYVQGNVQTFVKWYENNILDIATTAGVSGQFSYGYFVLGREVVLRLGGATHTFPDVPEDAFYKDAVMWAVENGITNGTGDGNFSPDMTCTRSQIVTFLWRAAGEPEPSSSVNPFSDVPNGSYYTKAVLWAVENGITNGTGNGKFSPDMPCTRSQVVTFLWRAAGEPEAVSSANPFSDVPNGSYYTKAVLWAVENEITKGTGNGKFSPEMICSRGQIVTFLWRAEK